MVYARVGVVSDTVLSNRQLADKLKRLHSLAADVIHEQTHGLQVVVTLGVVVGTAVFLELHRLVQQCFQPPWGQHHGGRQECYRNSRECN